MEEINKSFNIKSLQAFAEHTADFGRDEPDLEAQQPAQDKKQDQSGSLFSPIVKTVLLVLVAVLIVLLLVYFIYKKLQRNKPPAQPD